MKASVTLWVNVISEAVPCSQLTTIPFSYAIYLMSNIVASKCLAFHSYKTSATVVKGHYGKLRINVLAIKW